ncbi:hypothetical protein DPMN_134800 [Dreissena polymorpha]|uniref:Uncharacterized protein n=1 Tax=Dreissena polymorpha TaxID=45954 RepID=A0A9D4JC82_DREPO|nr:hypothetical protein DPMN_134800 [Dreissena polymorpha]
MKNKLKPVTTTRCDIRDYGDGVHLEGTVGDIPVVFTTDTGASKKFYLRGSSIGLVREKSLSYLLPLVCEELEICPLRLWFEEPSDCNWDQ